MLISRVLSPLSLLIWGVVGAIATLAGPFGTYEAMTLPYRALFWGLFVGLSIVVGRGTRVALERLMPGRRAWVRDSIHLVVVVPVITLMVLGLVPVMPGTGAMGSPSGVTVAGYVLAIGLIILGFQRAVRVEPAVGGDASVHPRLSERLPRERRGTILRLSGQDHHVEVVTTQGRVTLRMRLADAIREMEPVEGYCTHRSHWVARAAIERVERESAAKWWVVLRNGDRVPLTRTYRPQLQAAGIGCPSVASGPGAGPGR